jgi:hypothetical protein
VTAAPHSKNEKSPPIRRAFDLHEMAVARDEIDQLANYANGKIILTGSQKSWPPAPPAVDRGVFFVGFPGDGRTMRPYRGNSLVEIDWVGYTALAVASGVSNTDITLVLDHQHDFDVGLRPSVPSESWPLGISRPGSAQALTRRK